MISRVPTFHRPLVTNVLGVFMIVLGWLSTKGNISATPEAALKERGKQIYQEMCISCHGEKGQGVKGKYEEPIYGTRSLESLSKRIDRTMPEDDPDLLDEEGSAAVAAYIYDAFYSPEAQARNNPERHALTRLTVSQYRNSVMDLLTRFRHANDKPKAEERGLKARYSLVKGMGREKKFERVDPHINFNYGEKTPDPEQLNGEGFAIEWQGSLFAPETGHYEFIIKSQNGVTLWLNTHQTPTIDGAIASGEDVREEKKTVFLLGGRVYPMRLSFLSYKQKTSSIQLLWKPPHGVEEVIPNEYFFQNSGAERLVITTNFPADDRSDGYERGTTISKEWDRAITNAAIEAVTHVDKYLGWITGSKSDKPDHVQKLKNFAHQFVETAFRRPLNEGEKKIFVEQHFDTAPTPELAVKRVVLLTLKSPRFLYPELRIILNEQPDDFDIASRLALTIWDSIPDSGLWKMASEGKLRDPRQIAAQAARMLEDPRAKNKLHGFFHHWLELDRAELASKDTKLYPEFDDAMLAELRQSLFTFIDQTVWSEGSDFRQLINAEYLYLNERLAKYYGKNDIKGGEFQRVSFDPNQRVGLITHPYLLASFAYNKSTSPIHRGVFLTRNIVGMTLKSPPVAVAFEDSKFDPSLTMREKVAELTKDNACMACHSVINPLGFALENFDAVGRWRTKDNNKPIDSTGQIDTEDGKTLTLKGPRDIANYAMNSPASHRAFIRQLFHHFIKQPAGAYGADTLNLLRETFAAQNFNIKKLITNIAVIHAGHGLPETRNVIVASAKNSPVPKSQPQSIHQAQPKPQPPAPMVAQAPPSKPQIQGAGAAAPATPSVTPAPKGDFAANQQPSTAPLPHANPSSDSNPALAPTKASPPSNAAIVANNQSPAKDPQSEVKPQEIKEASPKLSPSATQTPVQVAKNDTAANSKSAPLAAQQTSAPLPKPQQEKQSETSSAQAGKEKKEVVPEVKSPTSKPNSNPNHSGASKVTPASGSNPASSESKPATPPTPSEKKLSENPTS